MAYIFSDIEWQSMYSNEKCQSNPSHFREHSFHYFLGQGQPEQFICNFIGKNRLGPLLIKSDTDHYGLTPLIICAMRCKEVIARALLVAWKGTSNERYINAADAFGFTALHHATLAGATAMINLLQEFGANAKLLTNLEGSVEDLKKISFREMASSSMRNIFIEEKQGEIKTICDLSQERLQELTGLELYRDEIYVQKQLFKKFWMTSFAIIKQFGGMYGHDISPQYPRVLVRRCQKISGWEIVAHEKIKPHTILAKYAGELYQDESDTRDTSYALFSVDAKKIGNFTRWLNWGFPNCIINPCPTNGYVQGYLISIEEVPEGQPLLWDYGLSHPLAFEEPHFLFGQDQMHQYFKQTNLQKCLELYATSLKSALSQKVTLNKQKLAFYKNTEVQTKISFVLNAPGALLDLHFNNIIKVEEWLNLYEQEPENAHYLIKTLNEQHPYAKWILYDLMLLTQKFEEKIVSPQYKAEAVQWILGNIGELSILSIMQGMRLMFAQNVDLTGLKAKLLTSKLTLHSEEVHQQISQRIAYFFNKVYKEDAFLYLTFAAKSLPEDSVNYVKNLMNGALKTLQEMLTTTKG